jgi:uncharacterized DUF497 family protein
MTAARIARRLARKIVKPLALRLADFQIAEAEAQADHYARMRGDLVGMEKDMRVHAVVLIARRNEIRNW